MHTFRALLPKFALPMSSAWLLNEIAEYKGRQELFARQAPQLLRALRDQALIQSVESSNRIEGVTVPAARLVPLVLGRARPRDRSEEDIAGYRKALDLIHTQAEGLPVTPETALRLHRLCQQAAGDAGQWKKRDNEIVELQPGQAPRIRFRCMSAKETPKAMGELCLLYRHFLAQEKAPPLIALAALVLDFLCIHPFRDGNGRVSRLLTLLALYHHGYEVGRYLSLERLVEESREEYYHVLHLSSQGWHQGRHDFVPWLNFFLGILRRAYSEFAARSGEVKSPRGAKAELVLQAIRRQPGEFKLVDIEGACPGVGREWIRVLLADMKRRGEVTCRGRGPAARWRYLGNEGSKSK
jgi:Fic family protein